MADSAVKIPFTEAAAPSTPAAGKVVLYAKTDGLLYSKDDAGAETLVSGGAGGGSVATDAIWDAAGDLAVGSGANTAARLAAGSEGEVLTIASGVPSWEAAAAASPLIPSVSNRASAYEASDTSTDVTTVAYPVGSTLIAVVYSTGRGANSITHTNVTWTQRYTGNGGSQYLEVWTGVVAGSPSGTTATVAFTGNNKNYIEIFELDDDAAITSATLSGSSTTATGTLTTITSGTLTEGAIVLWGISQNSPASSYSGCSHPFVNVGGYFGGAGRGGIFYARATQVGVWSIAASSTAYFGGFIVLA